MGVLDSSHAGAVAQSPGYHKFFRALGNNALADVFSHAVIP